MQPQATQTPPQTEPTPAPAAPPQSNPAAATPTTPAPAAPSKGYGKRSRIQWILIYLVVAIVVYGIIYFVWIRKSGGTSGY